MRRIKLIAAVALQGYAMCETRSMITDVGGTIEALRHVPHALTKICPGEARCRACLTSFCHSISTGVVTYDVRNILVCKLQKHYNRQVNVGIFTCDVGFSIVKYMLPDGFFGIQILPNSISAGLCSDPCWGALDAPQTPYAAAEGDIPSPLATFGVSLTVPLCLTTFQNLPSLPDVTIRRQSMLQRARSPSLLLSPTTPALSSIIIPSLSSHPETPHPVHFRSLFQKKLFSPLLPSCEEIVSYERSLIWRFAK